MRQSRGFAPIIVIVIIAILVLGGVGYLVVKQKVAPKTMPTPSSSLSPSPPVSPDDISGWNEFQAKYGFMVALPEHWEPKAGGTPDELWLVEKNKESDQSGSILFRVQPNTVSSTLEQAAEKNKDSGYQFLKRYGYYDTDQKLNVGSERAIQQRFVKPTIPPEPVEAGWEGGLVKTTFIVHGGRIFIIEGVSRTGPGEVERIEKTYDHLLSTLKFSGPPIDTSNWKTYRNEKYGFEVKVYPGWKIDYYKNSALLPSSSFDTGPSDRATANDINIIGVGCSCAIMLRESSSSSLAAWLREWKIAPGDRGVVWHKDVVVGGVPAVDRLGYFPGLRRYVYFVYPDVNNKNLVRQVIILNTLNELVGYGEKTLTPEFDAMLSSFKILK